LKDVTRQAVGADTVKIRYLSLKFRAWEGYSVIPMVWICGSRLYVGLKPTKGNNFSYKKRSSFTYKKKSSTPIYFLAFIS